MPITWRHNNNNNDDNNVKSRGRLQWELCCFSYVLVPEVAHELDFSQDSLGVGEVVERLGDLLYCNLRASFLVHGRPTK